MHLDSMAVEQLKVNHEINNPVGTPPGKLPVKIRVWRHEIFT